MTVTHTEEKLGELWMEVCLDWIRDSLDDEEDKGRQGPAKVHRAVFPRDFGRQNAKDVERRVDLVIG